MRCARLALALTGIAAATALAAPRAHAAGAPPSCTPPGTQTVSSAHFRVTYTDDATKPEYLSQPQAGTVLATAERAYASYVNELGFPAPAVGLSGKTELYITDLSTWKLAVYYCLGTADIDAREAVGANADYTIAATVFDEVGFAAAPGGAPTWLLNGVSSWAAWHSLAYPSNAIADIGPFDASLDCDSAVDMANCSTIGFENLGESRWPFYEYLAGRFGNTFAIDIFASVQAAGGNGLAGLQNAIAAKGSTLGAEYGAYATKLLTGGWTATPLNAATIPVAGRKIMTGASSGAIPTSSYGVNHLATKFVEIDRGDGDGSHRCYEATLTLYVQIPAGVTSQPTFYWSAGGSPAVPLSIVGSKATAVVPWDTCNWSTKGYLSLPNTSMVDGTSFTVSGALSVDLGKPASSASPPGPTSQYGSTIDAATISSVPELSLFGPQLLRLAADDTQLRVIVQSSGEGSAVFALGSSALASVQLRAGGNRIQLPLPAALLRTLRRSSATMLLSMTPVAPDGTTKGSSVTRQVQITRPVKTKVTVKSHVKPVRPKPAKRLHRAK